MLYIFFIKSGNINKWWTSTKIVVIQILRLMIKFNSNLTLLKLKLDEYKDFIQHTNIYINNEIKSIEESQSKTDLDIETWEIIAEEEIIIAYAKDGQYLKGPKDGGNGALWLIIPQQFEGDLNALRCVKYVSQLIIL